MNSVKQLLVVGIGTLTAFLLFWFIGIVTAQFVFKENVFAIVENLDFNNPLHINVLKLLQCIQSLGVFVITPFCIAYLFTRNPVLFFGLKCKGQLSLIFISVLIFLCFIPVINLLALANSSILDYFFTQNNWMKLKEIEAEKITESFIISSTYPELIINIIVMAIIPSVGEELLFRGIIQKILISISKNRNTGIILASVLFSAIHLQFYGFIPRAVLGMLLGYLYMFSGTILVPISGHFINNFIAVLLAYLVQNGFLDKQAENFGTNGIAIYFSLFFSVAGVLLFLVFIRLNRKYNSL